MIVYMCQQSAGPRDYFPAVSLDDKVNVGV